MTRAVSGSHVGTASPAIGTPSDVGSRKFGIGTFLLVSSYPVHPFNGFGFTIQYYIRITSTTPPITYGERMERRDATRCEFVEECEPCPRDGKFTKDLVM